jgi:predicted RNase H-like HicB family nuclease
MKGEFTAIFKKVGKSYAAWVEEIPGANTQGKTLKEAKENLKEALVLVLEEKYYQGICEFN